MELNEQSPKYREEYSWINGYLNGEVDWELLVSEVGEDMARGVRIAENNFKDDSKDLNDRIRNVVMEDIHNNGKISQVIERVYSASRMGDICGN